MFRRPGRVALLYAVAIAVAAAVAWPLLSLSAGPADPPAAQVNAPAWPNPERTGRAERVTRNHRVKPAPSPSPSRRSRPAPRPTGDAALEAAVIDLVNAARTRARCPAVRLDVRLRAAARAHSADMAAHERLSHEGTDGSTFTERAARAGYDAAIGENVAFGYPTAAAVMDAWMASKGHRDNILNCEARAIGVGLARTRDGTPYWTQLFGRV